MSDRGSLLRAFAALFLLALVASTLYGSMNVVDGDRAKPDGSDLRYGPIFEQPTAYRQRLLVDRWIRDVPVAGGLTFGRAIGRQVQIDIDGTGPIPEREVTLQTPPAVAMFSGAGRKRAEDILHGMQTQLEQQGGLVRGVALTESRGGYEAAAIAGIVESRVVDGVVSSEDKRLLTRLLSEHGREMGTHTYAWYEPWSQWVVLGPDISRALLRHVRDGDALKPADGIFAAFVVRHELEHTVTPWGHRNMRLKWIEEGSADTLARWPGAAAATAKAMGVPYPTKFERVAYESMRAGYPPWVATMRVLLGGCGIDVSDPKQLAEATELLQSVPTDALPQAIAERIAQREHLSAAAEQRLAANIARLDGSAAAARKLVRSVT